MYAVDYKKVALSTMTLSLLMSSSNYAQADDISGKTASKEQGYVNPPINPLPRFFSTENDKGAGDTDVPPPINPLPPQEVYIQTPNTEERTATTTTKSKAPKKNKNFTTKKNNKKKRDQSSKETTKNKTKTNSRGSQKTRKTTTGKPVPKRKPVRTTSKPSKTVKPGSIMFADEFQ